MSNQSGSTLKNGRHSENYTYYPKRMEKRMYVLLVCFLKWKYPVGDQGSYVAKDETRDH